MADEEVPFIQSSHVTARTELMRRREFLSVKDFGAVGDGMADDTRAFIYALEASGGKEPVLVPAGKYLLTKPLEVGHGVLWSNETKAFP